MRRFCAMGCVAMLLGFVLTEPSLGQCSSGKCPTSSAFTLSRPLPKAHVFEVEPLGAVEKTILELEKNALEKWYAGDPSTYIAMMDERIGYFEPSLEKRLDGRKSLAAMFEALRGKIHAERFDMLNTRVQATDKMAVLSCNLLAIEDGIPFRWNCTEVFALNKDGQWKLVHSHWSPTRPSHY